MTPTFCQRIGDELYVYVRGALVMKYWARHNQWAMFSILPGGVRGWCDECVR